MYKTVQGAAEEQMNAQFTIEQFILKKNKLRDMDKNKVFVMCEVICESLLELKWSDKGVKMEMQQYEYTYYIYWL